MIAAILWGALAGACLYLLCFAVIGLLDALAGWWLYLTGAQPIRLREYLCAAAIVVGAVGGAFARVVGGP